MRDWCVQLHFSRCGRLILIFVALAALGAAARGITAAMNSTPSSGGPETRAPRPLSDLEPHFRRAVLRGWRIFQTSHARDGVACVHCHPDHDQIRRWAGAYPKVEVFDGTPYRVKSLAEVAGEAWSKHADQPSNHRIDDLTAYIAWWGDGRRISPGLSRRLPPPDRDLSLLEAAAADGRRHFQRNHCSRCHRSKDPVRKPALKALDTAAAGFPRFVPRADRVLDLESYLRFHLTEREAEDVSRSDRFVVELSAYLHSLAAGSRYHPGRKEPNP